MSTRKSPRFRRVPIQFAVVAAVATGAAGVLAGAALASDDDDGKASEPVSADAAVDADPTEAVPIWITVAEQRRLRLMAAQMPSGWPATEAIRRAADQPLGSAADRERWSRDAERMPAGWPATEVMRRAAANDGG